MDAAAGDAAVQVMRLSQGKPGQAKAQMELRPEFSTSFAPASSGPGRELAHTLRASQLRPQLAELSPAEMQVRLSQQGEVLWTATAAMCVNVQAGQAVYVSRNCAWAQPCQAPPYAAAALPSNV
jgi:hypothetical protein